MWSTNLSLLHPFFLLLEYCSRKSYINSHSQLSVPEVLVSLVQVNTVLFFFFLIKLWYFYQCASSFVRVSLSLIVPGHNDFLWPLYLHLIHILCFSPQWITSYFPVPQNLGKPFLTPPSSEILIPFGPNYFQFTSEMFLKSNLQRRYGFSEALVSVAQSLYHKGGSL